ncbi:hypothetical protein [Stenotrophomonas muris]|uniref:hypothetical protein n=1 Tax=Stenotrophomonas muris TaxID=2963283 RepID=UPI0039C61837
MSVQLQRIVEVVRQGREPVVRGDSLYVFVRATPRIKELLADIHEGNAVRVFAGDVERYEDFADLDDQADFRVSIAKIQGTAFHVAQDFASFLNYQEGRFLVEPPAAWYLIKSNYLSGEDAESEDVKGYLRLPHFLELLEEISDFSSVKGVTKFYVFLADERFDLPIVCEPGSLKKVPSVEAMETLREDVFVKPRQPAKRELLKRSIVRHMRSMEERSRFPLLLRSFPSVVASYEAARDNFVSEFEFEKLNEKFERKREEYMLKIDSVCSDLLTKVLALPVAQAIVVSQYKDGALLANLALVFGSAVVSLLGVAFISNQIHAIREIRKSAKRERDEVAERYPDLYKRIENSYKQVIWRLALYARLLPAMVGLLLLVSFLFSVSGYDQAAPCAGCVARVLLGH